jgi:hypothetical protein
VKKFDGLLNLSRCDRLPKLVPKARQIFWTGGLALLLQKEVNPSPRVSVDGDLRICGATGARNYQDGGDAAALP